VIRPQQKALAFIGRAGKQHIAMKNLTLFLLVMAAVIPLRADILVNGNFADGRAHWKGDAQDPDTGGDLSQNPSNQGGVTITLKKDKWTKIYQVFSTHEKKLHYSITFTLSPDYEPDKSQPEGSMSPSPGLDDIEGLYPLYGYRGGNWMCITAQGYSQSSFMLHPDEKKTDSQTLTGIIPGAPDVTNDMLIVFAFPPGVGTITLTKVALTGDGDD
jgi:hypothetical protein